MTENSFVAAITVEYLNERNGNRPPSIKDAGGNYYTLSDTAYDYLLQQGVERDTNGDIVYYKNSGGYNVATDWQGQPLPKDSRAQRSQRATPANQGPTRINSAGNGEAKPFDYKQASIITQAFLKEIIKTAPQDKWSEMLDFAWSLHDDKLKSRAAAKRANGQHKTQITEPAPPPPPAPPIPTGAPEAPTPTAEVLDDQIPF